ncbi:MAG: hypothetical protein J6Q61_06485 [Bacteroidales bacterium]|nr:hypothetical protein [Bacteroidales bacterium]
MAIANSDGSIILSTKVDTSGLNKGLSQMQSKATKLTKTFSALGSAIASIFAINKIIQFSDKAANVATQTEASVQRLIDIYGEASVAVGDFIDQNARALGMSKSAAASFSSVYGNLFSVWADQSTNSELTNRYLQATAVVASKTDRTVEDVQERIRSGLLGNTEAIEDLGIFVNVKTIEMTDAFKKMADGKSWAQLDAYTQQQIRSIAILEQATAKYGNEVAETSATIRARYQAAYQDFQNSWGNIVNTVLLPVLTTLTKIFNIATAGLNFLAGKSGKTLENTEGINYSSQKTAENIQEQYDNQKELNKEVKKTLASFDEAQILSSQTGSAGISGGASTAGGELQGTGFDFSANIDGSKYVEEIDKTLTAIMGIVSVSLVAIGLILLFTGNILWGIGFIIAGAAIFAVTTAVASEYNYDGIIQMLTTIMGIAGGALLALGIILLWIGGVVGKGVAVGMIIAGAALIVSAVATNAALVPDDVEAWLSIITGIAGGALLALGVIICMFGPASLGLGVGLIIAGAVSLVAAVALNFEEVINKITGWVAVIMAIAGAALLVLGIVLCVTSVALPLGIALIAAGAISLVTPVALNWDLIKTSIEKFINENVGLIIGIASALLVLGIILCVVGVGVGLPIGIALIIAGAGILVTEVALNWDEMKTKIESFIQKNSRIILGVAGALIVLGVILCITGVLPIGIAFIVAGATAIGATAVLNWDEIKNKTQATFNAISEWVKTWGLLVLGIILCVTGVGIPLGIALIAKGAANLTESQNPLWNTMLNSVKETWQKIKDFWNNNIAHIFTLVWWKNLAINAGNGLITGFENAVNSIITMFERMINYIVTELNEISITIPDWVPGIGGKKFGFDLPPVTLKRVSIPRLAQGAVIPPNREFLAVLGDQKQGTNIETPLATMVEAFQMALDSRQNSTTKEEHYYLNETEIMTLFYRLAKGGERLQGESLVVGGAY